MNDSMEAVGGRGGARAATDENHSIGKNARGLKWHSGYAIRLACPGRLKS